MDSINKQEDGMSAPSNQSLRSHEMCAMINPSVGFRPATNQRLLAIGLNPANKQGYRGRNPRGHSTKGRFLLSVASSDPSSACIGGMEIDRLSTHPEACRRELSSGIAIKLFGQVVRQTGQRGNDGHNAGLVLIQEYRISVGRVNSWSYHPWVSYVLISN
jgi:hypothetical protein